MNDAVASPLRPAVRQPVTFGSSASGRRPLRLAPAMGFHPELHHRRSIRLPDFDYRTAGAYFVTVCTHERRCTFEDPELRAIAEEVWRNVAEIDETGDVDEFVIMPNHVHGIIWIAKSHVVGARQPGGPFEEPPASSNAASNRNVAVASPLRPAVGPPSRSLGAIVGSFKSATAKRINNFRATPGEPVWQRNYYEHVIRNEADLTRVRQYILDNPSRWDDDPENPETNGRSRILEFSCNPNP